MKKRVELEGIGSGEPVISLLGAEDLLPSPEENVAPVKKIKPDTVVSQYDFSLNGFQLLVCRSLRIRKRSRRLK
ncbi:hypothetical protein SDC9_140576 [bioreactor metagenome]|uniref:Uncharacterized protein n=1 Tax=bioreactor metagenome TaxID=1076179 RepID=A0A645DVX0_9ZZZZ